ncbi:MAG TPA: substrate-binding domain-containing protein [Baekduia sp.]|nr:substrate-binding domain-containing protein [Baekduia sp.]
MSCPSVARPHMAAVAGAVAALAIGCGEDDPRRPQDRDPGRVAAVIKGTDNPFFATMRDGLVTTARRQGVRLRLGAAAGLQDTAGQASTLEALVDDGAGCYVVNPITPTNLIAPLGHLPRRTPVVNIDSPIDRRAAGAADVAITTYIGTDNVAAGRLAAAEMARLVRAGARVAVITGIPGDAGSGARTRGFRAGARGHFDVAEAIAADFDRDRARLAAADLLHADRRIRGIFAVNDEMALGVVDAVGEAGRRGEVMVVGVDGIAEALDAVRRGVLAATVAQYPYTIGQLGVEACVAAARGRTLPARVDAPVRLVTRENVALALKRAPHPITPFRDPFARPRAAG